MLAAKYYSVESRPWWLTYPESGTGVDAVDWAAHQGEKSLVSFSYRSPSALKVKSISDPDLNIVSATKVDDGTGTLILDATGLDSDENLSNGINNLTTADIVLDQFTQPFLNQETIISSGQTTNLNNISISDSATLQSVNMDIIPSSDSITTNIDTWNTSGSYYKQWTETGSSPTITANHTIKDLKPNTTYDLKIDNTKTASYLSNSQGEITFNYTGGYSTKTFELAEPAVTTILPETGADNSFLYWLFRFLRFAT